MSLISQDQMYILRVLEKTRLLTVSQAFRLLNAANGRATEPYASRVFHQLRYMQKVRFETEDIVTPANIRGGDIDRDMLGAVDVMLDISDSAPLEIGGEATPFKLRFLTDDGDRVGNYGIITVPPGGEVRVNFQIEEVSTNANTIIFLLADNTQRTLIKTTQPHYFAVRDGDKYRYYAE